jgi:ketosteroid isomerase-like protein
MASFADPVKQQIWATVRAMNDAWTKGDPDRLRDFFHRDMVAINATDRQRLDGGEACVAGWKGFCKAARICRWEEIDPVIKVFGDSAVVAYYFDISFEMGGNTLHSSGRDMFFFVREGERWWAVADHFSPYPA